MHKTPLALAAALLWSAAAPADTLKRPDPLDPSASTTPVVHRSALGGYKTLTADTPPVGWRAANDSVLRIGGWRAYAREAQAPVPPAAPASAPAAPH